MKLDWASDGNGTCTAYCGDFVLEATPTDTTSMNWEVYLDDETIASDASVDELDAIRQAEEALFSHLIQLLPVGTSVTGEDDVITDGYGNGYDSIHEIGKDFVIVKGDMEYPAFPVTFSRVEGADLGLLREWCGP